MRKAIIFKNKQYFELKPFMHNQTVIMLELFYDWQGNKNINDS